MSRDLDNDPKDLHEVESAPDDEGDVWRRNFSVRISMGRLSRQDAALMFQGPAPGGSDQ